MRACWLKWVGRDWSISADYIWLNYSDANNGYTCYYYTQFYGDYLFHSIPYYQGTFNPMDSRMGMHISQGCVRLPIGRAKWIWDNVPLATKVVIY